jgi:hypothetical protein
MAFNRTIGIGYQEKGFGIPSRMTFCIATIISLGGFVEVVTLFNKTFNGALG